MLLCVFALRKTGTGGAVVGELVVLFRSGLILFRSRFDSIRFGDNQEIRIPNYFFAKKR